MPQRMERAYRNLGYVLTVLLPIFIAGFWIPYLSETPHFDQSITAAVHIHAVLLFCFLILLIVQPLAIRDNAFSTHRILGKLSNVIIPFALVFSVAMLWKEYHEHLIDGMTPRLARNAEFLSTGQLVLFGALYGAAIAAKQGFRPIRQNITQRRVTLLLLVTKCVLLSQALHRDYRFAH